MKMFKRTLLTLLCTLLSLTTLYAQRGGGGGRGGRPQGGEQAMQPITYPDQSAGLLPLDITEIINTVKPSEPAQEEIISTAVSTYQQGVDNLKLKHYDLLESLTPEMDRKEMFQAISTIKGDALPLHTALNTTLEEALSKKEMKRWEKYYKKICQEARFMPQMQPQGERPQQRPQR